MYVTSLNGCTSTSAVGVGVLERLLGGFPNSYTQTIRPNFHKNIGSDLLVLLPLPVSMLASTMYAGFASAETQAQDRFETAVYMYTIAAVLELCCEPMHTRCVLIFRLSAPSC